MGYFESKRSYRSSNSDTPIITRIFYRLHYAMYSVLLLGIISIFIDGYRLVGVFLILGACIGFVLFNYLIRKTTPKDHFDSDEDGNANPNYR